MRVLVEVVVGVDGVAAAWAVEAAWEARVAVREGEVVVKQPHVKGSAG